MLAYINNRLHFINKNVKPVILIYGSSNKRISEILKKIKHHTYHVQSVYVHDELPDAIEMLRPAIIIIGGRCKPETRLLIRYFAKHANNTVLFSEPGVGYENSAEAVVKDILYKIKFRTDNPLSSNSSLIGA